MSPLDKDKDKDKEAVLCLLRENENEVVLSGVKVEACERALAQEVETKLLHLKALQAFNTQLSIDTEAELLEDVIQQEKDLLDREEREFEKLKCELEKLKSEEKELEVELRDLETSGVIIEGLERRHWRFFNEYNLAHGSVKEKRLSIESQSHRSAEKLGSLQTINVMNDCFYIWHDGPYGIINGLRLGKLDQSVDWDEINAAWGQAALAISSIAKESKFSFGLFRIIPQGSYSKIAKIGEEKSLSYELYTNGGFFNRRRFDTAMNWFLNCVQELGIFAESNDRTMKLPYDIDGDRIGDLSIKITVSSLENWTRALKHMLMNLKWLLVWCAKQRNRNKTAIK
mmetsp:Transcript_3451/g.4345  ORF Transcript_3451/g.4345 Transcript_3451/m.4345 type:complete len:342 (+) Transcript_3451:111-1136(+)